MAQSSYRPDAIPVANKQCKSMEGNSNPNHTNPNTNHNQWPGLILSSSTGACLSHMLAVQIQQKNHL